MEETTNQTYLGITLDRRLTFKYHAQNQAAKAEKRLQILKRLTGSTWGTSIHTLAVTYKIYIHPVLTFGEELLICASDSTNKQLDLIQNKALRIITGGIKSTPITAMELITNIRPLKCTREKAAMKMMERIKRVPNNLFKNYEPEMTRLKSKPSFISKTRLIYNDYNIQYPSKVRKFTASKHSRLFNSMFVKAKNIITRKVDEATDQRQLEASNGKSWQGISTSSIKSYDKKAFTANFRRLTGHDLLYKHLHRIGVKNSPTCPLCQQEDQTSQHILCCPALEFLRDEAEEAKLNDEELFSLLYWHVRSEQI